MRRDDGRSTSKAGRRGDGRKESREYGTDQQGREERRMMHGVKQPGEEEPEEERLNRESRGEDTPWVSREMRQGTNHHPVNSSRQSTLPPEASEREQGAGSRGNPGKDATFPVALA